MATGTEIANAYVALTVKMPGVKKDLESALGVPLEEQAKKSGPSMGKQLMEGMNKVGKVGAIAVGGTIVAGIGTALVKGFQRLDSLDQATAKLTGLGHSAATVETIMDNALASVRGTAFGMGDAATVAANAVAAGIKPGQDLERTLKAVADASTIAGTDMSSMGAIFNKVAASNKVQMDVINQLHDQGVPALALLAEQMGVTAEEASKMASDGAISFADFQEAMESGMGGAALESGKTFSGAMDNVMASLGRMGASVLEGVFPDMKDGLAGLIEAMRPLEDVARDVGKAIKAAFEWVQQNWDWLEPFAIALGIVTGALIALNAVMWLLSINPITLMIIGIVAAVTLLIGGILLLVKYWDEVVAWITEVWQGFVDWIVAVIDGFVAWWNEMWEGFAGFIQDVWDGFIGFITDVWTGFVDWLKSIGDGIASWWNDLWSGIKNFVTDTWDNITGAIEGAFNGVSTFIDDTLTAISDVWESVWTGIGNFLKDIWNNIIGWIEGGVNAAIDLINGLTGGIRDVLAVVGIEVGDIPRVSIPRLAEGGFIPATPGGTLAVIGEGRHDEVVLPLSPEILGQLGGGGGIRPGDRVVFEVEGEPFTAVAKRVVKAAAPSPQSMRSEFAN